MLRLCGDRTSRYHVQEQRRDEARRASTNGYLERPCDSHNETGSGSVV